MKQANAIESHDWERRKRPLPFLHILPISRHSVYLCIRTCFEMTPEALLKDLKARKFSPVYIFCGEEPYYIDQMTAYIEKNLLSDEEKEFNQTVLYGLEVTADDVMVAARRFPMMSEYQVVIVKEAQLMKGLNDLELYLKNPQAQTILVISMKGKSPDKRTAFGKLADSKAVMVVTQKIKEDKVPEWFSQYVSKQGFRITARAAVMMAEYIGNDLEKITNEAEKLFLHFQKGHEIHEGDIENLIGISKEYSIFEYQKALAVKDVLKANRIAFFFGKNEKNYPIQVIIATLFSFFSKVIQYQWLKSQNERDIAKSMGVNPFFIRDYEQAARMYSTAKLVRIMHSLRDYDLKSKGLNNVSATSLELLKEMTFKIVH